MSRALATETAALVKERHHHERSRRYSVPHRSQSRGSPPKGFGIAEGIFDRTWRRGHRRQTAGWVRQAQSARQHNRDGGCLGHVLGHADRLDLLDAARWGSNRRGLRRVGWRAHGRWRQRCLHEGSGRDPAVRQRGTLSADPQADDRQGAGGSERRRRHRFADIVRPYEGGRAAPRSPA